MTVSITKERLTALSSEGIPMGYITFPQVRAGLVNIDQVVIHPSFRGQGVAEEMMEALLRHLTKQGRRAALTSSFAQQYLENHPQWNHLLPGQIHFTTY